MLLVRLFQSIRGYVVIRVWGYFLERFLNICARRNLYLWDIKRLSSSTMEAKVSVKGFRQLRPVAKKSRCKVHLIQRKGLPFFIARYRKRYAILVGIVLFLAVFYGLTSFVWVIEVTGNESQTTEQIVADLAACGTSYGTFSASIDTADLANRLRIQNDYLAWVGIEVSGSKLKVSVKERVMPPEIYDKNAPANIVAKRDGVIDQMIVRYGSKQVQVGDTVRAGQLLVSGVLEGTDAVPARYVNSEASIVARTWYEKRQTVPLTREVRTPTGEQVKKNSLKIWNFQINFYRNDSIPYAFYDTIETEKDVVLFGRTLPFMMQNRTYTEVSVSQEPISEDEAANGVLQAFEQEVLASDGTDLEIVNRTVEKTPDGAGNLNVRVILECTEDIAQKQPMQSP